MKVQIISYEWKAKEGEIIPTEQEEIVHEEFELEPVSIDDSSVVFHYKDEVIKFTLGRGETENVRGYIHPVEGNRFLFMSEEEWTSTLSTLQP